MKRFVRNLVLSAAVAATALAAIPASAQERRYRMGPEDEKLVGIGFLGLAAGVAIGAIAAEANARNERNPRPRPTQSRRYYNDDDGYDRHYRGRHSYRDDRRSEYDARRGYNPRRGGGDVGRYDAWTPGWARWCENRYRSFNINTGTYTTYGGEQRFCVVQ